jgi:fumarate hydratase class II
MEVPDRQILGRAGAALASSTSRSAGKSSHCRWSGRSASSSGPARVRQSRPQGDLDAALANAIVAAAQEVIDGKLDAQLSAGGLADRLGHAVEHERERGDLEPRDRDAGGTLGSKKPVHPNDHVNMSQSSNDTYPTAMHVAASPRQIARRPDSGARQAANALWPKAAQWQHIIKIGRTHTQDATPLTLGQEFSGYTHTGGERHRARRGLTLPHLMNWRRAARRWARGSTRKSRLRREAWPSEIAAITGLPFTTAPNKFEALAAHDAMVCSRAR